MIDQEILANQRLNTVQKTSLILTNEFLFCLLYILYDWNRPLTSKKLARDLAIQEKILVDHFNLLVQCGFVKYEKKKYRITETGKEGVAYAREAVGKTQYRYKLNVGADLYSSEVSYQPTITMAEDQGIETLIQSVRKSIKRERKENETFVSEGVIFSTKSWEIYENAAT